jgi:hypothetical protein
MSVLNVTLSVCEAADSDIAEYTAIIEPLDRSVSWTVTYRFTYFRVLKDLIDSHSSVEIMSPFPKISKVSWIFKMDGERLTRRKKLLQRWLLEVIAFYNEFPDAVKIALSSFLNGTNSAERIENFIDSRIATAPVDSYSILDRCFVSVTEIESADPPLYVFCISSLWGRTWTVTYWFTSFCKLYEYIMDRYPKLMVTTFPDTTIRSLYRVKLRFYDLADRHFKLKAWMSELLRRFDEFPVDVQEQVCKFYEAHPEYQPVEVYMEVPKNENRSAGNNNPPTSSKGTVVSGYSNLKGSLLLCVDPFAGANKLLIDLGLADDVLWTSNGRICSGCLSDIAACLDDPRLGLRTKCPSLDVKRMIAVQFVKWADIKLSQYNEMSSPSDPPTAAQEDWNWEVEIIQSALPAFYDVIYTIAVCRDDDDVKTPARRGTLKSNSFSLGGDYQGYQVIGAKLAASLRSLNFLEHRILPLSFQCLERILDSGVALGPHAVLGTMHAATAQSMRTETCVSLLGLIPDVTRHINSIRNASSVVEKLLKENTVRPIPAALKATAALIQGVIARGQMKQKRSKSVVLNVPLESSPVLIAPEGESDSAGVGVLGVEAAQALRQLILSPPTEISHVARMERRKSRRLSNEDMTLLKLASGEYETVDENEGTPVRTASPALPSVLEQETNPKVNSAQEGDKSKSSEGGANMNPNPDGAFAHTSAPTEPILSLSGDEKPAAEFVSKLFPETEDDVCDNDGEDWDDKGGNNPNVSLKELYRDQLRSAFDGLCFVVGNEGRVKYSRVTLESLLGWEMIQEVISSGELTEDKIAAVFSNLAVSSEPDSPATIDFDAFCSLMEVLEST